MNPTDTIWKNRPAHDENLAISEDCGKWFPSRLERKVIERLCAIRRENLVMAGVEFQKVTTPQADQQSEFHGEPSACFQCFVFMG